MSFWPLWVFWIFCGLNDLFSFTSISTKEFLNVSIYLFILCGAYVIQSIKDKICELSDKVDALDDKM